MNDFYATERWPAMLPAAFAGDGVTIDRITITAKPGAARARYDDLMIGRDLSLVDAPFSSMLIRAEAVLKPDSELSKGFVESLRATGSNAVRHWGMGLGGTPSARRPRFAPSCTKAMSGLCAI